MRRVIARLDSMHKKLLIVATALDSERFSQRPADDQWSVAEIMDHLRLVEERVIQDLEKALAASPQKVGFLRRLVPTSVVASRLLRVKAPKAVTPLNPPEKSAAVENFNAAREKLKSLCLTYGEKRLRQVAFTHPFLGKIDGLATVSFVGYHEQRHYKQIRETVKKLKLKV